MFRRDNDGGPRDAGAQMGVTVQVILGLFLMSAFVGLIWLVFGGS